MEQKRNDQFQTFHFILVAMDIIQRGNIVKWVSQFKGSVIARMIDNGTNEKHYLLLRGALRHLFVAQYVPLGMILIKIYLLHHVSVR